jgi:uncharacterized protein YbbK (DUF523 family)
MRTFPKPIVVTSRCFEWDACRYNGLMIPNNFVQALEPWVEFRPVCPELEIGLGVPRDPVRIVRKGGGRKLVQPATGRDLTGLMSEFSARFLDTLSEADGFILKSLALKYLFNIYDKLRQFYPAFSPFFTSK